MKTVTLLRISYLTGAVLDFLIAAAALVPVNMGVAEFVHPMGSFSVAAFSWGVLLLIALKEPLERRWVLVPTILIVVLGLAAGGYSVIVGIRSFSMFVPEVIAGACCILLWTVSYVKSTDNVSSAG